MSRSHTIKYCEKCTKRSFSPKSGIICSLTEAPADFIDTCPTYEEDEKEARMIAMVQEDKINEQKKREPFRMEKSVLNGGIVGGILAMVGATVWFFVAYIYMDIIFFYPPVLFVIGVISLVKGIAKRNEENRKKMNSGSILDDF